MAEFDPIDPTTTTTYDNPAYDPDDDEEISSNYVEEGARPKEGGAYGGLDPSKLNEPGAASTPKSTPGDFELTKTRDKNIVDDTSTSRRGSLPFKEPTAETTQQLNELINNILEEKGTAVERIQKSFKGEYRPKEFKFGTRINEDTGDVLLTRTTEGGKTYEYKILDKDGEINETYFKDPNKNKNIQSALGNPTYDEVVNYNRRIRGLQEKAHERALDIATTFEGQAREQVREKEIIIRRLQRELEIAETNYNIARNQGATREVTAEYNDQARRIDNRLREMEGILEEAIDRLKEAEQVREQVEERLTLKEKIKRIFKKHGFTVVAVVTAVGVVIGTIVSNLAKGLSKVARGVGNALKSLGKKVGEILPGMVGAIASFIFRTAGQVISFLGKHAWLLNMAVVLFFVEQFKGKRRYLIKDQNDDNFLNHHDVSRNKALFRADYLRASTLH